MLAFAFLIAGCTSTEENENTGLANPSATFCVEQGYTYDIRTTPNGQSGYCVFNDSTECEGWDYFRGECDIDSASTCKNLCGDGECQGMVCQAIGCPCAESAENCAIDCSE